MALLQKVKKAPVERTEDGLPLKKRTKYYITGEKLMEKSPSPIIKVEEDSDHEI